MLFGSPEPCPESVVRNYFKKKSIRNIEIPDAIGTDLIDPSDPTMFKYKKMIGLGTLATEGYLKAPGSRRSIDPKENL